MVFGPVLTVSALIQNNWSTIDRFSFDHWCIYWTMTIKALKALLLASYCFQEPLYPYPPTYNMIGHLTVLWKWNNSAIKRNCWISARVAIKLHPFVTSAEWSGACMPKGCNFIALEALIPQLYYYFFILLLNYRAIFDTHAEGVHQKLLCSYAT